MNAYVYGYGAKGRERLILVDLGVTFANMETSPGVDLIMADLTWLKARADRLEAIFITHAHEDHIGALGLLWGGLGAPVYCRKFTAYLARMKLEERGERADVVNVAAPYPATIAAGPFKVSFLPVAHSIPESSALVIDTPAGRLVHTGDFKLDGTPVVGEAFNPEQWHEVAGKDGVHALICDSTNIFSPHPGRSEETVAPDIDKLVAGAEGLVAATTFASNVARLKTLARAGNRAGRSVVLLGRAMRRMVSAALETGVLDDFPPLVSHEQALNLPHNSLMLLTTGSQGERRAATAQLSRGKYLGFELREGDLFLFSSRTIPGNEREVSRIVNNLSERGIDVVDDSTGHYHVSGHANRPDLEAVHELMKPDMLIPMHGEHRHLREHAGIGAAKGLASIVACNGTMLDITTDRPVVVEHVETGRVYLDGSRLIGAMDGVVRDRIRMALNGLVVVSILIDEDDDFLGEAWALVRGLARSGRSEDDLARVIEADLGKALHRAGSEVVADDDRLELEVRRAVRRTVLDELGKKAEVAVLISRMTEG